MLMMPSFYFSNYVSTLTGTPPLAVTGINFTAGASSGDGAAVSVLSALAFDAQYLVIGIAGLGGNGTDSNCLMDVLADPAGGTSWASLIDDLVCGYCPDTSSNGLVGMTCWYYFPLFIKAGTSLGVRARTSAGSPRTSCRVDMHAWGNPSRPDVWWCGQKVESLGINAGNSKGTDITPGATGVWGSWASIGTSTARYGAMQWGLNGSDNGALDNGYYWEVGFNSVKLPSSQTGYTNMGTSELMARFGFHQPIWCDVASGTAWQIRGMASGAGEIYDGAVYGVY